jgi:hypothetical protein
MLRRLHYPLPRRSLDHALGAIRFWGRPALGPLGHYLRVPPSNVVGARGSSMRIPTWLLVLLVGAGILLLVVVSVRLIL